jgi:cytochrome c oxidase subunit 3
MPATFTRHPVETERKDPGIGGKPPVTRRPTGGGGEGDNWDKQPPGRRGPRALLTRYRTMVLVILTGDMMLFLALVVIFFLSQGSGHFDTHHNYVMSWHAVIVPRILWINTLILALSSITMEIARRQLFREIDVMEEWLGLGRPAVKRAVPWLVATAILGTAFLAGQCVAWQEFKKEGYYEALNPARDFFYLITGTHAAHLVLGVLALVGALGAIYVVRKIEYRQILVDCTAWYWHSMGLFWFVLFGLLLYGQ